MHEYLFDLKMFTALRIRATDEAEARRFLAECLHCAEVNFGAGPDGEPLIGEASMDSEPDLIEVDGEMPEEAATSP